MSTALSTAPLSPSDRAERWRDVVSSTFIPLDVEFLEKEPSPGTLVSTQLGPLRIAHVKAGPQTVTRTSRHIARQDEEFLTLSFQWRGTALKEQDGRESLIEPGQFSLSDSSRSFRKRVDREFSFTSFHFPRQALGVRDEDLRTLTATAFAGDVGSAGLVATYFACLARHQENENDSLGRRFATTGLDLLALFIAERCGRFDSPESGPGAAVLVRVKDHIRRNLSDPELSPSSIAAAHFVSVRYLHKLFEPEGTSVSGWIRMQRLERCRRELLRSPERGGGVAAVARRWGFVSPSHFSRAFRVAYGMTPRDWQLLDASGRRPKAEAV
ncbi:AraC-like ligand-binding domain-containing protein [Streptomyces sp. NPDC002513]